MTKAQVLVLSILLLLLAAALALTSTLQQNPIELQSIQFNRAEHVVHFDPGDGIFDVSESNVSVMISNTQTIKGCNISGEMYFLDQFEARFPKETREGKCTPDLLLEVWEKLLNQLLPKLSKEQLSIIKPQLNGIEALFKVYLNIP